ncbi:hypothetical protein HK096_010459, partial [Nowakowskiella sp. JEL0078]
MAFQCLLAVRKGTTMEGLVKLEKYFHLFSWGIPIMLETILCFIDDDKGPSFISLPQKSF